MLRRASAWLVTLGTACLGLEAIVRFRIVSPAILAAPSEIAVASVSLLMPSAYLPDVISTLAYALAAFVLSIPIGVVIGLLVGTEAHRSEPMAFILDFLRSIPSTALVPAFFLIAGAGATTKLAAGCFSSCLVISLATIHGLRSIPSTRREIADLLGLSGIERIALVSLPSAAREILLGCRTGVSLALILVVVSEMLIGDNRGLGRVIFDNRYTDDKPLMYAAILATGVLGYILNVAVSKLEEIVIYWRS